MDYQVWIKEDFAEVYTKVECGDLPAVKRELDKAVRAGQEPILTVLVPYSIGIKIEEVGAEKPKRKIKPEKNGGTPEEVDLDETEEGKAESDQSS